jgi:hypothetical protein
MSETNSDGRFLLSDIMNHRDPASITIVRAARRVALVALFSVFGATAVAGQDMRTVMGVVTDSGGRTVAYVSLDGGAKFRTITNAVGEWRFLVPTNAGFDINVRRIGFLSTKVRVEPGADTTIRITIQQLAVLMTTQVVRAQQQIRTLELRGFYERMLESQRGALVGAFILPEEIEMRNPQRVSQLIEGRQGVQARRFGACNNIATCYRIMGPGGCAATVFLDGQRLNRLADASGNANAAPSVDELIPVSSVSGVEVYSRGALAPSKYQSLGGTCAIVLIWTK